MERNNKVSLANCPKCNAVCLKGHDDDGQVMCAKCGNTFRAVEEIHMNSEEYKAMTEKAQERHERGGWTAFTID